MTSTETIFGDEGESISYTLDDVEYEIDPEDENASEYHVDLDTFEAAGSGEPLISKPHPLRGPTAPEAWFGGWGERT